MSAPPKSTIRVWLTIALAFTVVWTVYLLVFGPQRQPALDTMQTPRTRLAASFDWSLFNLSDQPVSFSQFKGKTVFLNIWATWCPPCVREMPSIARLATAPKLKGKPIEFVCVSTDDSTEAVRSFLKDTSWTMTFLRADAIPPVFRTDGIPATFIIAPDGHIVAGKIGGSDWDAPPVIDLLEALATAGATEPVSTAPKSTKRSDNVQRDQPSRSAPSPLVSSPVARSSGPSAS